MFYSPILSCARAGRLAGLHCIQHSSGGNPPLWVPRICHCDFSGVGPKELHGQNQSLTAWERGLPAASHTRPPPRPTHALARSTPTHFQPSRTALPPCQNSPCTRQVCYCNATASSIGIPASALVHSANATMLALHQDQDCTLKDTTKEQCYISHTIIDWYLHMPNESSAFFFHPQRMLFSVLYLKQLLMLP